MFMGFSRQDTGVGCHFLLQGIFPTQCSNLHLKKSCWECQFSAWVRVLLEQTPEDHLTCLLPWDSRHLSAGSDLRPIVSPRHVALGEERQLRELHRRLCLLLRSQSLPKVPNAARPPPRPPPRQVLHQVPWVSSPLPLAAFSCNTGGNSSLFAKDLFSSLVRAPMSSSLPNWLTSLSATAAKAYLRPDACFSLVTTRCIYFYSCENMFFMLPCIYDQIVVRVFFFPWQKWGCDKLWNAQTSSTCWKRGMNHRK